jgi:hypothetical protein
MERKPSDRDHSWTDLGVTMPANPVVVPQVDEYVGPGFEGYVLTTRITVAGDEWIVLRDDYRWTMTTPESSPGAGDDVWEYVHYPSSNADSRTLDDSVQVPDEVT